MPSLYALYVVIGKDVVQIYRQARDHDIMAKFTPDYYRPVPRWLAIGLRVWFVAAIALFVLISYLLFAG
jgi:hypothetical protein